MRLLSGSAICLSSRMRGVTAVRPAPIPRGAERSRASMHASGCAHPRRLDTHRFGSPSSEKIPAMNDLLVRAPFHTRPNLAHTPSRLQDLRPRRFDGIHHPRAVADHFIAVLLDDLIGAGEG
jgi:hypothetical protein